MTQWGKLIETYIDSPVVKNHRLDNLTPLGIWKVDCAEQAVIKCH